MPEVNSVLFFRGRSWTGDVSSLFQGWALTQTFWSPFAAISIAPFPRAVVLSRSIIFCCSLLSAEHNKRDVLIQKSHGFTLAAFMKKKIRLVPQVLIRLLSLIVPKLSGVLISYVFKASVWATWSWNKSHLLEVHSLATQRLIRAISHALVVPLGFVGKIWSITSELLELPNREEKTIYNPLKIAIRQKQNYYVNKPKVFNINWVAMTSAWGLGMAYISHQEFQSRWQILKGAK